MIITNVFLSSHSMSLSEARSIKLTFVAVCFPVRVKILTSTFFLSIFRVLEKFHDWSKRWHPWQKCPYSTL